MPVPKRKTPRGRRRNRRSHGRLSVPALARCPSCYEPVTPHQVCKKCGAYKGSDILELEI